MLSPSDKERLATLEADIPWIKGALARIELATTELHDKLKDDTITSSEMMIEYDCIAYIRHGSTLPTSRAF